MKPAANGVTTTCDMQLELKQPADGSLVLGETVAAAMCESRGHVTSIRDNPHTHSKQCNSYTQPVRLQGLPYRHSRIRQILLRDVRKRQLR